jgi:2-keto-4-pentenoate hydratase/2-oxohepta-3-ene-1,7-dioic acid hydratase in catechol pathway
MKLRTFLRAGATRVGVVAGDHVVDLAAAAPALPRDLAALLAAGPAALARAKSAAASARERLPLASLSLAAPILRPPKFLAIGLNYADHVAEASLEAPRLPTVFNKQSTCVAGPNADLHLPRISSALEPGDVVATGTPGGVGIAMKPPRLLKAGDVVRVEIESLGALENRVIAEPENTALIAHGGV